MTGISKQTARRKGLAAAGLLALASMLLTASATADVIYFKSGRTIMGLSTIDPHDPDVVHLITDRGSFAFHRSQIEKIVKQADYKNRLDLGEAFLQKEAYEKALEQFKIAEALNPDAAEVKEALEKIKLLYELLEEEQLNAKWLLVETNLQAIKQAIAGRDFVKAEAVWQQSQELLPTPEQQAALQQIRMEIYYQWALDRLDRIDEGGAKLRLEELLAFAPENQQALGLLIELYEKDPAKIDFVLNYWLKLLELTPGDIAMQLKVADLYYEKTELISALPYFLAAHLSDEIERADIERKLRICFEEKHDQLSRVNDFEGALACYRQYMGLFPELSPEPRKLYEYAIKIGKVNPDNLNELLEMAEWSFGQGLHSHAERLYQHVYSNDKENKIALAGLTYYANIMMGQVRQAFAQKNYLEAQIIATEAMSEYAMAPGVKEEAEDIWEASRIQYVQVKRDAKLQAADYVRQGDEYFSRAMSFLDQLLNRNYTDTNLSWRLFSPRTEAQRYFTRATNQYAKAMALDPTIGETGDLRGKIADSQRFLSRLSGRPLPLPRFERRGIPINQLIDRK